MFKSIDDPDIIKTLDVLKNEYYNKKPAANKELCLVIGNKRAGKSTLIQFLANNGNALESIAKSPRNDAFLITLKDEADSNATIYTLIQSNNNDDGIHHLQFLEFLSFEEIENFEKYMTKVMAINTVLNQATGMKVLLVVDVDLICDANQRSKFTIFFQQVTKIIDSITGIKLSIGMVITKVKSKTKDSVLFQKVRHLLKKELKMQLDNPSNSAAIKYQVLSESMDIATLMDCQTFSNRYNTNIVELFKTLLSSHIYIGCRRIRTPDHISIFRMPDKPGLVSDNEMSKIDRSNILRLVRRLDYSEGPIKLDLSYPLWESHKDYVSKLVSKIKNKLWTLSNILFEYYDMKNVYCNNIFELKRLLNTENTFFHAILPNAHQAFEFILQSIAELLKEPASQAQIYQPFVNNELPFLIEVLQFLYASKNIFQNSEFESVGAPLQKYFEKWGKFSTFLLTLEEILSNARINHEGFWNFDFEKDGWLITENNFQSFLTNLGMVVNLEDFPAVEDLFLKHLNELLLKKLAVSLPDLKKNLRETIVAKDYVLVIGSSNVGKTTLIQFLTGISLFQKNNEKGSKYKLPNVVTHGSIHYIDCPSWIDEPSFNSRLEIMMLIEDLLMIMDSFKLLFVVEMDKPGMSEFLFKAALFLNDIEKYRQAIGIVVTKSKNSDLDMDNDAFVSSLLNEVLHSSEITVQVKKFFKQTLTKRNEKYERLGFLPNMDSLDQPQNYNNLLHGMIGNLKYMQANTDDFNFIACLKVESALAFVVRALDDQYRDKLVENCDIFDLQHELIDIDLKIKSFILVATDLEKQDSMSFTRALMTLARIDEMYSIKHLTLLPEYSASNMLCMLGSTIAGIADKEHFEYGISNAFTSVLSTFLINLLQALSNYEVQQNKHLYNVKIIDDWGYGSAEQTLGSGINITGENVHDFLKKIKGMVQFDHIALSGSQCLNGALLKNLNQILTDTLNTETMITHIQSQRKLQVRGSFILSSSLPIDLLEEVDELEIFATNIIFIDKNINCMIKLKKITIVSPTVEIHVPIAGVIDCFVICQKLIVLQKIQKGIFGVLDMNVLDTDKTRQTRNFYNYDHCSCQLIEQCLKYLELSKQDSIQMSKLTEFIGFIEEEVKRYMMSMFGENYQIDVYLTLKSLITQLQSLDLLYFELKLTQPMLHWYKKMLVEVQDYQTSRQLDDLEKTVCENLNILILTKINSFANLSQHQQLVTNVETHYQKMKRGLKRINKLEAVEALQFLNTKYKEKMNFKIMEVEVYLTKLFVKSDVVKLKAQIDSIFNNEGEYQNKPEMEALTVKHIVDIVLAINAKLKTTEIAIKTITKFLEYGSQMNKSNQLMQNLIELCNDYKRQFKNRTVETFNMRLEIFTYNRHSLPTKYNKSIKDISSKIKHLQSVERDDDIEKLIESIEGEFKYLVDYLTDYVDSNTEKVEKLIGFQKSLDLCATENQDIIDELSAKIAILAETIKDFPELDMVSVINVNVDKNMDALRLEQETQPKDDMINELKDNINMVLTELNTLCTSKIHQLDVLKMTKKNYELAVLSNDLYVCCKNDPDKIVRLCLEMQPWMEGLKKLTCFKAQIQKSVLNAMITMKTGCINVPQFLEANKNCAADRLFWQFKEFITSFLLDFEMHNFAIDFLEKTYAAIRTMNQLYNYVEQYQLNKNIVKIFEIKDVNTPKTINDDLLEEFFLSIDDRIKSNVILKEYNRGMVGIKNYVFPFAHECLPNLMMEKCNGKMNYKHMTAVLFVNAIENIKLIRRKTKDSNSPILQLLEQRTVQYNFFTNSAEPAIFVWKHEQYSTVIWNLLKGEPVTLMADIERGYNAGALKFYNLELSFKARNGQQQSLIDDHLQQATIKMRHSGNSYYKVGGKVYLITSEVLRLKYTYEKDNNDELVQRKNFKNIKSSVPILSPFTTWKFEVVLKNRKKLGVLFDADLQIDLLMLGSCSYLGPLPTYDLHVSEHYQLVDKVPNK